MTRLQGDGANERSALHHAHAPLPRLSSAVDPAWALTNSGRRGSEVQRGTSETWHEMKAERSAHAFTMPCQVCSSWNFTSLTTLRPSVLASPFQSFCRCLPFLRHLEALVKGRSSDGPKERTPLNRTWEPTNHEVGSGSARCARRHLHATRLFPRGVRRGTRREGNPNPPLASHTSPRHLHPREK